MQEDFFKSYLLAGLFCVIILLSFFECPLLEGSLWEVIITWAYVGSMALTVVGEGSLSVGFKGLIG